MIKILRIIILVIGAFTFTNCDNHEFPKTDYPNVRTLAVSSPTSSGATFTGELSNSGNSSILSYGFVWTEFESNNPEIGPNDTVETAKSILDGTFSLHADYGFIQNRTYYVRAYIETKDYIVYGEEVSFVWK